MQVLGATAFLYFPYQLIFVFSRRLDGAVLSYISVYQYILTGRWKIKLDKKVENKAV